MSDTSGDMEEFDPATREAIEAAAEEAGVSVEDYVADRLLLSLLVDAREDAGAADDTGEDDDDIAIHTPPPVRLRQRESAAVGHRLEAMERRVGQAAASIEETAAAFDASIVALGERLDDSDEWADENADIVNAALADLRSSVDALSAGLGETNANLDALTRAHESLRAQVLDDGAFFDQRLSVAEEVARGAEATGVALTQSQELLKRAIASDFIAYALENDQKLAIQAEESGAAIGALRRQIDDNAHAAEAGDARVLADVLAAADTLSQRVSGDVARLDSRIDAAADHVSALGAALTHRVEAADQALARFEDHFINRLADQRRDLSAAISELGGSLEHARAALAANLDRVEAALNGDLDKVRADLRAEIAQLAARQQEGAALSRLLDASIAKTGADLLAFKGETDGRFDGLSAQGERNASAFSDRLAEIAARIEAFDGRARHANKVVADEVVRVEACTLAALEAAAQSRKSDAQALQEDLRQHSDAQSAARAHDKAALAADIADLREQHRGVLARLSLTEEKLAPAGDVDALRARLDQMEAGAEHRQSALREAIETINVRLGAAELETNELKQEDIPGRLQEFRATFAAQQAEAKEAVERLAGLARLAGDGGVQTAEIEALTARMQALETALAAAGASDVGELRSNMSESLEDVHMRLVGIEHALAAQDFETLRRRIEERNLALETKTVRALDQLTRTVALLSRKFALEQPEDAAADDTPSAQSA